MMKGMKLAWADAASFSFEKENTACAERNIPRERRTKEMTIHARVGSRCIGEEGKMEEGRPVFLLCFLLFRFQGLLVFARSVLVSTKDMLSSAPRTKVDAIPHSPRLFSSSLFFAIITYHFSFSLLYLLFCFFLLH